MILDDPGGGSVSVVAPAACRAAPPGVTGSSAVGSSGARPGTSCSRSSRDSRPSGGRPVQTNANTCHSLAATQNSRATVTVAARRPCSVRVIEPAGAPSRSMSVLICSSVSAAIAPAPYPRVLAGTIRSPRCRARTDGSSSTPSGTPRVAIASVSVRVK